MRKVFLRILIVIIFTQPLSGCLLGAVASATGWVITKEIDKSQTKKKRATEKKIRREEQANFKQQRSLDMNQDQKLQAKLAIQLLGGGLTKIISVHAVVKDGVVTLYGNVPSPAVAYRAIETARRTLGVRSVVSNIVVVEYNITPATKGANSGSKRFIPNMRRQPQPSAAGMSRQPPPSRSAPSRVQPIKKQTSERKRRLIPRGGEVKYNDVADSQVRYVPPPPRAIKREPLRPTVAGLPWQQPSRPQAQPQRRQLMQNNFPMDNDSQAIAWKPPQKVKQQLSPENVGNFPEDTDPWEVPASIK